MTREENLDWLYRLKSEIFVFMPKEWLIPMADALDEAIKALEQEPVLDKIRAEIVELTKCPYGTECLGANCPSNTDCMICGDHVLEILDKYKAESDIEKREEWPHKPCINEDGCEEWAGCPCVHYKAESEEV